MAVIDMHSHFFPAMDAAYRAHQELRGGSGIVRLTGNAAQGWSAVRDIRLERHPG